MVVDNTVTSSLGNLATPAQIDARSQGLNLFLTGFLVLFLELACIRWFAANVIFLQFFTNVVLLACFLGMSCGCMAAHQGQDWLRYFPILSLATVVAALALSTIYGWWSGLVIDVGHQKSPQEIFFGTFDTGGSSYSLVHLLEKAISGLVRFRRDSAPT